MKVVSCYRCGRRTKAGAQRCTRRCGSVVFIHGTELPPRASLQTLAEKDDEDREEAQDRLRLAELFRGYGAITAARRVR